MNTQANVTAEATPEIGTPVYFRANSKAGFIAEIEENGGNVFMIGAGGLVPEHHRVFVVWEDGGFTAVSLGIARPWIDAARDMGLESILNAPEMLRIAKVQQAQDHATRKAEAEEAARKAEAYRESIKSKIPAGAKAVILAELIEDQSDSMSDYFGSTVTRVVVLAFSTHTRDLFPEMRKAARNFDETAHLFDAPESAEHREKWSMGGGYYLKTSYRHSDGWKVSKSHLNPDAPESSIPAHAEWKVPTKGAAKATPAKATPVQSTGAAFAIEEHTHTKKGFQMWLAVPAERVERDTFDAQRESARQLGGWWSRPWGRTPGGFAFKSPEACGEFVEGQGAASTGEAETESAPVTGNPTLADKLRGFADGLQKAIDHGRADRLENTPKRQRQAAGARQEADNAERAQTALRALADHHDAGTVPPILADLRTKADALELARERIDYSNSGYYDAGRQTGEPSKDSERARAFWSLAAPKSPEQAKADARKLKLQELARLTIPGYFPTPDTVADDMARYIDARDGESVLEPEAGSGSLVAAVKRRHAGARVEAYEINRTLCDLLEADDLPGVTVSHCDFMEQAARPVFDSVIMNPPFERGQDMDHVRHAFGFLKPGGRMAAIMAPGFTFKSDRRANEFREWLETVDHYTAELPAGTFKDSGTMVSAVVLYIEKGK